MVPEPAEPPPPEPPPPADPLGLAIDEAIEGWTLREQVAGLVVATYPGMDPAAFRAFLETTPVAGFLFTGSNLQGSPEAIRQVVAEIQRDQDYPLIIAVDQEGNPVARIAGDPFPGARTLGQGEPAATTEAFAARNELVHQAGANVNFGVVADVSPGPQAYIHPRSFGTDPGAVAGHVAAAVAGSIEGVAQTLKHFPGHGMVTGDSHREIPETSIDRDLWRATHALPFVSGIEQGAPMLMLAHVRVTSVSVDPASLSNDWVDIARGELGFDGVIITDDLSMLRASGEDALADPAAAARLALIAGNDLILVAVDPGEDPDLSTYTRVVDALTLAVMTGEVSQEHIERSLERVLRLRSGLQAPSL